MHSRTKGGQAVLNLAVVPFNSCGRLVTYPVKGSIVRRKKPEKLEYQIWSIDGKVDVVWHRNPEDNLIIPEGLMPKLWIVTYVWKTEGGVAMAETIPVVQEDKPLLGEMLEALGDKLGDEDDPDIEAHGPYNLVELMYHSETKVRPTGPADDGKDIRCRGITPR